MRHGQAASSPANSAGGDYDRPLTSGGAKETASMATWLQEQQWQPDAILCSAARRTRETAEVLRQGLSLPQDSRYSDPRLYLAEAGTILSVLAEQPADWQTLIVVGHNPGVASLIAGLSGQHHPVPPATMALLEAQTPDWQLSGQTLQTVAVRQPMAA